MTHRHDAADYRARLEAAAVRVQCRWRCHNGQFAYHLKQSARRQLAKEEAEAATAMQSLFRKRAAKSQALLQKMLKTSPLCDECAAEACALYCWGCGSKFCEARPSDQKLSHTSTIVLLDVSNRAPTRTIAHFFHKKELDFV